MLRCFQRRTWVSFLVSGRGVLFASVAKAIQSGKIRAKIGALITDNRNAGALDRAHVLGIPAYFVDPALYEDQEGHEKEIIRLLKEYASGLIVTAGYLRLLTPFFVRSFRNRIINIHPSLLPSFPGLGSQERAIEYGVRISGCTAHFIDGGVDTGPIIKQVAIPVRQDDTGLTLSAKIHQEERRILIDAVKLYCDGRLRVVGRRVTVS